MRGHSPAVWDDPRIRRRRPGPAPFLMPGGLSPNTFPATPLTITVLFAPGADLTAAPESWPWQDISQYVRQASGIQTTTGRTDEASQVNPGTMTLELDNRDGRFSRRNPSSPYYGTLTMNTPIWVTVDAGAGGYAFAEMFVNEWPIRWDRSGNDCTVPIACAGVLRRLNQGGVSLAPMTRTMLSAAGPTPAGYWAMDDGSEAVTSAQSTLSDGNDMEWSNVTPAGETGLPGTGQLATFAVSAPSRYVAVVTDPAATPLFKVRHPKKYSPLPVAGAFSSVSFVMRGHMADTPHPVEVTLCRMQDTNGGLTNIDVFAGYTGGALTSTCGVKVTSPYSTVTTSSVQLMDGEAHTVHVSFTQNPVGQIETRIVIDGALVGFSEGDSGTLYTPATLKGIYSVAGTLDAVTINNAGATFGIGQLVSHTSTIATTTIDDAARGYPGEAAHDRIERLCAEEGTPYYSTCATSEAMGPQPAGKFLDAIRDAETVDMGVIYEKHFGLAYQGRSERYNAPVLLTLDFDNNDVAAEPEPADDDQRVCNRYTASRTDGITFTATDTDGALGTSAIGFYDQSATLNVYTDAQVISQATWRVHMGTVDEDRWPSIALNFGAHPEQISTWAALPFGPRMQLINPPSQVSPNTIDAFIEGRSEYVDPFVWTATVNTTPAAPFNVGVMADNVRGKLDTSGSELTATWDGSSGTFTVQTTDSSFALWTTDAAQYPFDLKVGAQRVTVSGCAGGSNPQTFTVSVASVNGVSQSHAAGTAVSLWVPFVLGL